MKYAEYLKLDKKIAAGDGADAVRRWAYGAQLLADRDATTPAGHLRHGVQEGLLYRAREAGVKLSASEIKYRLQAAKAYGTETEFASALAIWGSWRGICDAGFEVPLRPDDDEPAAEPGARPEPQLDFGDWRQIALFPGYDVDVTLRDLVAQCRSSEAMTESFQRHDLRRRAHVDELVAAVGGNLDATYADAARALRARAVFHPAIPTGTP